MVNTKTEDKTIGILIPAYNPDPPQLIELIHRLKRLSMSSAFRILVVDDGSEKPILPDGLDSSVKIIRHVKNEGKGAALKTGFRYFSEMYTCSFVITLDADLQHPPESIPGFIRSYHSGAGQLIVGYRSRSPGIMPLHRIFSNTFTSLLISILGGQLVRDSQNGFRLIDSTVLKEIVLKEQGFHLESELLIKAAWRGYRIGFVKVPTIYADEKSSIHNVKDTVNFLRLILQLSGKRLLNDF